MLLLLRGAAVRGHPHALLRAYSRAHFGAAFQRGEASCRTSGRNPKSLLVRASPLSRNPSCLITFANGVHGFVVIVRLRDQHGHGSRHERKDVHAGAPMITYGSHGIPRGIPWLQTDQRSGKPSTHCVRTQLQVTVVPLHTQVAVARPPPPKRPKHSPTPVQASPVASAAPALAVHIGAAEPAVPQAQVWPSHSQPTRVAAAMPYRHA
jgi:hypothetical protein